MEKNFVILNLLNFDSYMNLWTLLCYEDESKTSSAALLLSLIKCDYGCNQSHLPNLDVWVSWTKFP